MLVKRQGLTRKNVFFVVILIYLAIACLNLDLYAYSAVNEIIKLEKEKQKLNEEIINSLNLRFSKRRKVNFYGENYKCFLKDRESDDLWLFKIYKSSFPANATVATYRLAELLGLDVPDIAGITLIINEQERYGSIQKMIPGVKRIDKIPLSQLSSKQVESIMKNHVLDWLVFNSDMDNDEFLIEEKTGRVIAIDKDKTFSDEEKTVLLEQKRGKDFYCHDFWGAYLKGEIIVKNVSFKKVFELIDCFQRIDDEDIINILDDLLSEVMSPGEYNSILKAIILKKHNLRRDFEKFYKKLTKNKGFSFSAPSIDKDNTYAQFVLDKLKENIYQKKSTLARLKIRKLKKQEKMKIIACFEVMSLVNELRFVRKEEFFSLSNLIIKKIDCLKKKKGSVYEQFVMDLYIEQIRDFQNRRGMEKIISSRIKQIVFCLEEMTNNKILRIEHHLRVIYGQPQKKPGYDRKEIERKPGDILVHLDYIQCPVKGDLNAEEELILKKYKEWVNKYPSDLTCQVLYGIVSNNEEYLKGIEDSFAWKHLGLALIYSFGKKRGKAIKECKKALICKNEGESTFCAFMLLGFLYEYKSKWERFEEGLDIKKAVEVYKKAVKFNPESVKAHLNLGVLYLMSEKPDKALEEFKEVNRLDFQYGKKHFNLDKINKKSSYRNKKEYLEAIRMNTLSGRHHYILGLAYLIKEDKNLAQRHFNKAKEFGYNRLKKIGN